MSTSRPFFLSFVTRATSGRNHFRQRAGGTHVQTLRDRYKTLTVNDSTKKPKPSIQCSGVWMCTVHFPQNTCLNRLQWLSTTLHPNQIVTMMSRFGKSLDLLTTIDWDVPLHFRIFWWQQSTCTIRWWKELKRASKEFILFRILFSKGNECNVRKQDHKKEFTISQPFRPLPRAS